MRCHKIAVGILAAVALGGWGWLPRNDDAPWPHAGPMPDDPVKVRPYQYDPITRGNQSYRPIDPLPWGDVNRRVAPPGSLPAPGKGGAAPAPATPLRAAAPVAPKAPPPALTPSAVPAVPLAPMVPSAPVPVQIVPIIPTPMSTPPVTAPATPPAAGAGHGQHGAPPPKQ